jgi:hypothetical protein
MCMLNDVVVVCHVFVVIIACWHQCVRIYILFVEGFISLIMTEMHIP